MTRKQGQRRTVSHMNYGNNLLKSLTATRAQPRGKLYLLRYFKTISEHKEPDKILHSSLYDTDAPSESEDEQTELEPAH